MVLWYVRGLRSKPSCCHWNMSSIINLQHDTIKAWHLVSSWSISQSRFYWNRVHYYCSFASRKWSRKLLVHHVLQIIEDKIYRHYLKIQFYFFVYTNEVKLCQFKGSYCFYRPFQRSTGQLISLPKLAFVINLLKCAQFSPMKKLLSYEA